MARIIIYDMEETNDGCMHIIYIIKYYDGYVWNNNYYKKIYLSDT